MRLLRAFRARPLIEAARRDDAATVFVGAAKHRSFGEGLGARIESRRKLAEGLSPPRRHKSPAHGHKLIASRARANDLDRRRRRDVEARREIPGLPDDAGEPMNFRP